MKDSFPFEQQRKQYELYASKLENRYPLCATCTYRVSVQLKRCEDDASLIKRRGTASSGGDWVNKLKLAEKMKWSQTFRRFIKAFFFWPDFLFQLSLVFKCILKTQTSFNDDHFYFIASVSDFKIWLPKTFEFSSLFHVLTIVLFLFQFNGIALSRSNSLEIIPQLFLVASRIITGNFLFRFDKNPVDLNVALTCAAVGLALVFRTGSRNAPIYRRLKQKSIVIYDSLTDTHTNSTNDNLFTRSNNIETLSARAPDRKSRVINAKNGFATYSQDHYKFHSFANMVGDEQSKPIMPWPEKPLPGRLNSPRLSPTFNFDENINNFSNSASAAKSLSVKLRPTKLGSFEDPLELEPMFSSFSLSDEPKRTNSTRTASEKAISEPRVNNNNSGVKKRIEMQIDPSVLGNILLTLVLVIIRVYLIRQTSLISVILAITFGLRGFVWPRLPLKAQLTSLAVALGRLIWLGAVLNGKIEQEFEYFALALDLILIILR